MGQLIVVYWRDIPAQVIARAGRRNARRQLSERFLKAIDRAAMRAKLHGTDDYLEQWRRAAPLDCGDDLDTEAEVAAARLEEDYPEDRVEALIARGGLDQDSGGTAS